MVSKIVDRTLIVRAVPGEDLIVKIEEACKEHGVRLGIVSGIGACDHATVGAYSVRTKEYTAHTFDEEMEILALMGNITTMNGEYYGHMHATLGREDGSVVGGHANELVISATSEVFIQILDGTLDRIRDEEVELNVLELA